MIANARDSFHLSTSKNSFKTAIAGFFFFFSFCIIQLMSAMDIDQHDPNGSAAPAGIIYPPPDIRSMNIISNIYKNQLQGSLIVLYRID